LGRQLPRLRRCRQKRWRISASPWLVSEYTFDNRDAFDALNVHAAILAGRTAFTPGPAGGADQALQLDGDGHLRLGVVSDFAFPGNSGAIEAWVRADWSASDPSTNDPCLFSNRDGDRVRVSVHLNRTKDEIRVWNGRWWETAPIPAAGNGWHHFVSVFDDAFWRLHWDGVLVTAENFELGDIENLPCQFGSTTSDQTTQGWIGAMDEIAVYRYFLWPEDVTPHYHAFIYAGPVLSLRRVGGQLELSWPVEAAGFVLEAAAQLPAAGWTPVGGVTGTSVRIPTDIPAAFFRLKLP